MKLIIKLLVVFIPCLVWAKTEPLDNVCYNFNKCPSYKSVMRLNNASTFEFQFFKEINCQGLNEKYSNLVGDINDPSRSGGAPCAWCGIYRKVDQGPQLGVNSSPKNYTIVFNKTQEQCSFPRTGTK